ncbi:MAG: hypothetical protein DME25_00550 [Verrucomicrobia bacterium]|nr:MAG: hypothetical protein DME25_00550 [Verrucomicrobiota bacterium]
MGVGPHAILCTASDCSGNSTQCTFYVFVQDTNPPSITCPTNITIQCGDSTSPTNTGMATAHDVCDSNPRVTYSDAYSGDCPKTLTRTWIATDYNGNTNTCPQIITIQDTNPPSITVPASRTVQCFGDVPAADSSTSGASDTCGPASRTFVGDTYQTNGCVITITRTYRATDACGNTNTATQTITIQDTNKPSITAPAGTTVQCFGDIPAPDTNAVVASDNCGTPTKSFVSDTYATNGCVITVTRTYKATDFCGNYNTDTQTITVQDTNRPSITAPAPVSVQCFGNIPAPDTNAVTASDNCGTVTKSFVRDTYATNGCVITITRTYRATDACGNYNTDNQTITVQDTNKPSITAPGPVTVQCFGNIPAPDTNAVVASDNCSTPTKSFVGDTYATNGCVINVTRTYKATDRCGNFNTDTQTITVQDTNKPSITPPGPVTVQCFGNIPAPDTNAVTASDNCGSVTKSLVGDTYATNGCVITVTRTYKATDRCGNYATTNQTITVQDTNKPTIMCPTNIVQAAPSNQCTAIVNYTVTAADNCGNVTLVCTPPPGSAFPVGTTTVNCKATDACSNSASCSFTVTVYSPTNSLPPPNPLPACDTSMNTLTGPPGFATYSWSIISSTGPNWAITSGTNSQTVTYTAGSSGSATFQLIVTTASGCRFVYQVTFACNAGGSTPGFWGNKNGQALLTSADFTALNTLCLRTGDGSDRDFKSTLSKNKSDFAAWLQARTAVNMSYMLSSHLAAMKLNVLHGFASPAKVVPIGGCGNLNGGNSITIADLITFANNALCADGYTPSQDPNRTLQECYKNALANANGNTVHP